MTIVFDLRYAWEVTPDLLATMDVTVKATCFGFLLAVVLGVPLFLGRRSRSRTVSAPTACFIELIRSTPLLMQLYIMYFVLPNFGIALPALLGGTVVLGIHYACYASEVYRAAFAGVPATQWEAAYALGLTRFRTAHLVILPQMLPTLVTGFGTHLIALFKDTSILSAIGVAEMLATAKELGSESFRYTEPMTIAGAMFLVLSLLTAAGLHALEHSLGSNARRSTTRPVTAKSRLGGAIAQQFEEA